MVSGTHTRQRRRRRTPPTTERGIRVGQKRFSPVELLSHSLSPALSHSLSLSKCISHSVVRVHVSVQQRRFYDDGDRTLCRRNRRSYRGGGTYREREKVHTIPLYRRVPCTTTTTAAMPAPSSVLHLLLFQPSPSSRTCVVLKTSNSPRRTRAHARIFTTRETTGLGPDGGENSISKTAPQTPQVSYVTHE